MDCSEITLNEMNDSLLSIIKCSACSNIMVPPIYMCSKGHSFCQTCKYILPSCSTCKELFIGRNHTMQKVAELVIYPCKYVSAGCDIKLRVNDKVIHEQDCLLRRLPCLFSHCKSEVSRCHYIHHLYNTHLDSLVVETNQVVRVSLRNQSISEWVFSAFDRFFLVKFTTTSTELQWSAIYEGSREEASKFNFTFTIRTLTDAHYYMRLSGEPISSVERTQSITTPRVLPVYLAQRYSYLKHLDILSVKIKVRKIQ